MLLLPDRGTSVEFRRECIGVGRGNVAALISLLGGSGGGDVSRGGKLGTPVCSKQIQEDE